MATEGHLLLLLFLSGWLPDSYLQVVTKHRRLHLVETKKTWSDAQSHCRENFDDLATILDVQANTDVQQLVQSGKFWIGLYRTPWRWSMGNQDIQPNSWFNNWASNEPMPGRCVAIRMKSKWEVRDCEEKHFFSCYSEIGNTHILVQEQKTWSEAQSLCRDNFTDLSSVVNQEVGEFISTKLLQLTTWTNPVAWIGLHRDEWMWSDGDDATYRQWAPDKPDLGDEDKSCVLVEVGSKSAEWDNLKCSDDHPFLCQSVVESSSLRIMKVKVSAGSADLGQPDLQHAVIQKLHQKLEEQGLKEQVKFSWRTHPDGNVFHAQDQQEEETTPPVERQRVEF